MQIFSYRRSRNTRATSKEICKIRLSISLRVTCIFLNQYSRHRSDRHKSRNFTFRADRLNTEFQSWGLGHRHSNIYCVKLEENFDYLAKTISFEGFAVIKLRNVPDFFNSGKIKDNPARLARPSTTRYGSINNSPT
mgnify:FL=1